MDPLGGLGWGLGFQVAIQGLCSDIFPIMENQIENEEEVNLKLEVHGDTGFKLVRLTCWFLGNK